FERHHRDVRPELIEGLRRAYEAAGVWFVDEGPHAGSVTPPPLRVPTPGKSFQRLRCSASHVSREGAKGKRRREEEGGFGSSQA
ncbi:MAG TPA: hypothetical protein VF655_06665, partial [Allosphingosinicella sp.]